MKIRNNEACTVAIVSSNTENVSNQCEELLIKKISNDNIKLLSAGDIWTNEKAIDIVMKANYIILAERQGSSKYSELEQTCKQLESWNKEILGTVLLDVDAL